MKCEVWNVYISNNTFSCTFHFRFLKHLLTLTLWGEPDHQLFSQVPTADLQVAWSRFKKQKSHIQCSNKWRKFKKILKSLSNYSKNYFHDFSYNDVWKMVSELPQSGLETFLNTIYTCRLLQFPFLNELVANLIQKEESGSGWWPKSVAQEH